MRPTCDPHATLKPPRSDGGRQQWTNPGQPDCPPGAQAAFPGLGHFGEEADIELVLSTARPHCLRVKLVSRLWRWLPPAVLLGAGALVVAGTPGPDYAIVVSRATETDRDWRRVVEVLREKHRGAIIVFDASVEEAQPRLRAMFPRYACFVARPGEVSRRFVAQVHRLTCKLDDDPYPAVSGGF